MSDIKVIADRDEIVAVADNIRSLTGKSGAMTLAEMATAKGSGSSSSGGSITLQTKSVTPTTSAQQVKPDSGYDGLSQVNVGAIPSNYIIPSGTKSITSNGTHDVTQYANVNVNVASSGSGGSDTEKDGIIDGTVTSVTANSTNVRANVFANCANLSTATFPKCTTIYSSAFMNCTKLTTISFPVCSNVGSYAFRSCTSLTSAVFPSCTMVNTYAFAQCSKLTTISFPVCSSLGTYAFASCSTLTDANLPSCQYLGSYAFAYCSSLGTVSLGNCTSIYSYAFRNCTRLSILYLTGSKVCTLGNSNVFSSTPIAGYKTYFSGTPIIYVPASLLASYKAATNWTRYSSYFVSI